jgi:hypothetical protein
MRWLQEADPEESLTHGGCPEKGDRDDQDCELRCLIGPNGVGKSTFLPQGSDIAGCPVASVVTGCTPPTMNIGKTSNPPLIRGRIKLSVVDLIAFHQRLSVFVAFRRGRF